MGLIKESRSLFVNTECVSVKEINFSSYRRPLLDLKLCFHKSWCFVQNPALVLQCWNFITGTVIEFQKMHFFHSSITIVQYCLEFMRSDWSNICCLCRVVVPHSVNMGSQYHFMTWLRFLNNVQLFGHWETIVFWSILFLVYIQILLYHGFIAANLFLNLDKTVSLPRKHLWGTFCTINCFQSGRQ